VATVFVTGCTVEVSILLLGVKEIFSGATVTGKSTLAVALFPSVVC